MAFAHFDFLRSQARRYASASRVPFSGKEAAAVLLLSDGRWVPGVRVESAAFSLTIPPLLNAYSTAVAAGRADVQAAVLSRPVRPAEQAFLNDLPGGPFHPAGPDACAIEGASLAEPVGRLDPFIDAPSPDGPAAGVALARTVAEGAVVPFSHFPVGCVLDVSGQRVPGVNVEHPDWMHVLCAERNALGTACTYELIGSAATPGEDGAASGAALYLSCTEDPSGSPCGACRQLLVELVPQAVLWMDRAPGPPERARPKDLLPGSFRGTTLSRPPRDVPSA